MKDDIRREDRGDVTVLSVPERLDTLLSEALDQNCTSLLDEGRFKVVIDCERLEFLNSTVIAILVGYYQKASKNNGDVKFANVSIPVEDVLRLTKLDTVFKWYPNVDDAVMAFQGSVP